MALTTLADSSTSGPIFSVSLAQAAAVAASAVTGGLSAYSLDYIINGDIVQAEANEPDGTQMQMVINGWLNPITGTDYSADVAEYINQEWVAGNILGSTGDPVEAWGNATSIAYSGSNQVTLQWTIGSGPSVVGILVAVAAGLVALVILINEVKGLLPWTLSKKVAAVISPGGGGSGPSIWGSMPLWEKIVIIGVPVVGIPGFLIYKAKVGIASAGAARSTQNIYVEPR